MPREDLTEPGVPDVWADRFEPRNRAGRRAARRAQNHARLAHARD